MLLFTILLLPLILCFYCFSQKSLKVVMPIFIGTMAGILLCLFKVLFLYAHRVVPYDFFSNFIYLIIRQSMLPAVLLYGLFFLFSKDDFEYKGNFCYPLLISFYMIYLPYSIISTAEGLYSFFSVFLKPVLFFIMIYLVSYFVKLLLTNVSEKNVVKIILYSLLILITLVVPSVLEAFIIIKKMIVIVYLVSVIYCLIPVGLKIFSKTSVRTE